MKKAFMLLSLILMLSIVTACGENTGDATVTPPPAVIPDPPVTPANNPVPATSVTLLKFTDSTTSQAIKLDYSGTEDYTFVNYLVLGDFDITSTDCTIDTTAKTLKVKTGGCTLNAKAKATAIVASKNSAGAVMFGSSAVPLAGSGAGAPEVEALKQDALTIPSGILVYLSNVTQNEKYKVTFPKYLKYGGYGAGAPSEECTEKTDPDSAGDYTVDKTGRKETKCFFLPSLKDTYVKDTLPAFVELLSVTRTDTTKSKDSIYTFKTFSRAKQTADETTFAETTVNTRSPELSQPFNIDTAVDLITFNTGFFTNFKINKEWTTCSSIKEIEAVEQSETRSAYCTLVIDFVPTTTGDISATAVIKGKKAHTFKGKGK